MVVCTPGRIIDMIKVPYFSYSPFPLPFYPSLSLFFSPLTSLSSDKKMSHDKGYFSCFR